MNKFIPMVVCVHVSVSAFLYNALRKNIIPGLSAQTVLAIAMCEAIIVAKKLYWPISDALHGELVSIDMDGEWKFELSGYAANTAVLLASLHLMFKSKKTAKVDTEVEDDFGRSQVRHLWYAMFGQERTAPAFLHWSLIYVAAFLMSFCTALVSSGGSPLALASWAYDRPTAMMAIYDNYLRAFAWLPQLHISRKVGVVSSVLAFWITMLGAVDITELLYDGFKLVSLCYIVGDIFSCALIADFMWIFVQSRLRGRKVLELPMYGA